MSIDKIPENNINNFYDQWMEFVRTGVTIMQTIGNSQFFWTDFWRAWNGAYNENGKNPFPINTYMYHYYEMFVRPMYRRGT